MSLRVVPLALTCAASLLGCAGLVPPSSFEEPVEDGAGVGDADDSKPTPAIEIVGSNPEQAWVSPRFRTAEGELRAGTAFVCRVAPEGPVLLLTAHHLFGPAGGLSRDYGWDELGDLVTHVEGMREAERVVVHAGAPRALVGAEAMGERGPGRDLAAFELMAPTRTHAMALATQEPAVGDPVWLIGPTRGSPGLRHRAVVAEIGDDYIVYVFDEPIELRATSGAAVVNAADEVVAVNLAPNPASSSEGGQTEGVGNPSSSIRRMLAGAGQAPPA